MTSTTTKKRVQHSPDRDQHSKKVVGESGVGLPSMASSDVHRKVPVRQRFLAFVNSNSLSAGSIFPELLPGEERNGLCSSFIPKWHLPPCEPDYFFDSIVFPAMEATEEFSLSEFPDDLLVEVFRRVHCTDRIRSISLVCRRWNRLLYTEGLWKSVCLNIWNAKHYTAAKAFLERESISHSLVKLCLRFPILRPSNALPRATILPKKLPKLLYYHSIGEAVEGGLEFLDEAMPMLETLVLSSVRIGQDNRLYYGSPESLAAYTSQCRFEKLRNVSIEGSLFRIFPLRENVKELNIYGNCFERENAKYPELQKLRLRDMDFRNSFLQILRTFSKLVALDMSLCSFDLQPVPCLQQVMPQIIAIVRNLHFLEHLHLYGSPRNCPVLGLFAPPERKSDFPSRLKYLSLSYTEPIVVQELTLSCPELRSLYLNSDHPDCAISESVFIQIAERLRNLRYLRIVRMNSVTSSVASVLSGLEEDALPHLRYLQSGTVEEIPGPFLTLTIKEYVAEVDSLLLRRPTLTVVSGPLSLNPWFVNGKAHRSVDRLLLHRLLGSEEGACCIDLHGFGAQALCIMCAGSAGRVQFSVSLDVPSHEISNVEKPREE